MCDVSMCFRACVCMYVCVRVYVCVRACVYVYVWVVVAAVVVPVMVVVVVCACPLLSLCMCVCTLLFSLSLFLSLFVSHSLSLFMCILIIIRVSTSSPLVVVHLSAYVRAHPPPLSLSVSLSLHLAPTPTPTPPPPLSPNIDQRLLDMQVVAAWKVSLPLSTSSLSRSHPPSVPSMHISVSCLPTVYTRLLLVYLPVPHSRAPKKNTSHGNEVLPQDTAHLIHRPCYQRGSPCQDQACRQSDHTKTSWPL